MEKYVLLKYHGNFYLNNWRKNECAMYLLDKSVLTKYKSMYESNKDNTLVPNSTIHFSKLTKLPQYKLKEYINNNKLNIKKSRNINDIDTLIISNELINEYFNETTYIRTQVINEYYKIPKAFYEKTIKPLLGHNHRPNNLSDMIDDADSISYLLVNKDSILKQKPSSANVNNIVSQIKQFDIIEGSEITNEWGSQKAYETCNLFTNIVNNYGNYKFNIVFDEKLNQVISEDMTMDIDVFSNIIDMLNSDDESNLKLAKEIVSNLDPISSKPYLLLLLHLFPDFRRIDNNTNFRYLLQSVSKEKNSYVYESTAVFLSNMLNTYPEYKQQMFEGLGEFINKKNNKNIITEIKVS
jgi:hypothetical protein